MEISFALDVASPWAEVAPALFRNCRLVIPEAKSIFSRSSADLSEAIFTHMNRLLRQYSQGKTTSTVVTWKGLALTHLKRVIDPVTPPELPWKAESLMECLKSIDYQTYQTQQSFYLFAECEVAPSDGSRVSKGHATWNLKIRALRMYDEVDEVDDLY